MSEPHSNLLGLFRYVLLMNREKQFEVSILMEIRPHAPCIEVAEGVVIMNKNGGIQIKRDNLLNFLSLQKDKREELSKTSLSATTTALESFIKAFIHKATCCQQPSNMLPKIEQLSILGNMLLTRSK